MYIANVKGILTNNAYQLQRKKTRQKGFVWIAYLLAYSYESKDIYNNISCIWTELDAITGQNLAFIFSDENAQLLSFDHRMKHARYLPDTGKYSIGEKNSSIIDMFKSIDPNIEFYMPCLILCNLISDNQRPIFIKLNNDSNISAIMKYISIRTSDYLSRVDAINNAIITEYLRGVEEYHNMKMRILRYCDKHNEDVVEINQLFYKFEEDNFSSYDMRRLVDRWESIRCHSSEKLFGDTKGKLIYNLVNKRSKISDFHRKYARFLDLNNQLDVLLADLQQSVKNVNTDECKRDAINYAIAKIDELNANMKENGYEAELTESIYEDLLFSINHPDNQKLNFEDVLEKIRQSKPVTVVDDIGRIMTIFSMIEKLVSVISIL